jgi:hypothetical protein
MMRFFGGIFFVFCFIPFSNCVYNEKLARSKLYPMAAAAYSNRPEACVKDIFGQDYDYFGQFTVLCDETKVDTCSAFIVASHFDQSIILSFRGSQNHDEVTEEEKETLTHLPLPFIGGGKANAYFMNAFEALKNGGMGDAFLKAKNRYSNYTVWITGHSLGAALASITAGSLSKLGYISSEKILLITFGQPRVGNIDYANAMDSLVSESYRIVHANDLIPHLPPKGLLGYFHHKSEVWYNNDMSVGSSYIICEENEGAKCSNSGHDFNWGDHGIYFNKGTDFASNGCK